ncbi:MAG: TonB-dependent receptor [Candidatus Marinimicrobia bacterium]|nr:TonB-dependent receptor [Candidatus Neomarinimicrobiota bacterium]
MLKQARVDSTQVNWIFLLLRNGLVLVFSTCLLWAQPLTQTIKGKVLDQDTQAPLIGANIIVKNSSPVRGATTDNQGAFWIEQIKVGRYDLLVTYIGYESYVVPEVLVSSAKEVVLKIQLEPSSIDGEQVLVEGSINKAVPQNSMAVVSARSFTVEEARRYAGGMDDPARLAAAFAGVTTGAAQDNAIVVRGNSAKGLLWQVEGVRIPSPNHFPDINVAGGGFVSVLSSHVLDNSDFYTGAFPAEYGNALSGVFDMRLREGNREQREYTVQAGVLGLDLAAEGPIPGLSKASYLFNYRYSTLALIKDLIPSEQIPEYSDLAYKISVPTKRAGKFTIWGLNSWDLNEEYEEADSSLWTFSWDRMAYDLKMGMSVIGMTHKMLLSDKAYIHSSLAQTEQSSSMQMYRLDDSMNLQDNYLSENSTGTTTLSSYLNTRLNQKHTNRTGLILNCLYYNFDQQAAINNTLPLTRLVKQDDSANLLQAYTQSRIRLNSSLTLNTGFHLQYFSTNEELSFEPRLGLTWNMGPTKSLSLGYGNHSQLEELRIYFIDVNGSKPNEGLKLSRAHHLVMAYQQQLSINTRVKIEPYFQAAYNVPVIQDSSFSMLNFTQDLTFNSPLVNEGQGHNYGIDLTLERFLTKDMYYLLTTSIFESKYTGGDGVERNTRYATGYVINGLVGKEYRLGRTRENMLGVSLKLKLAGGARRSPANNARTVAAQEIITDEYRAFEKQDPSQALLDISITYRKNKASYSSVWALQLMNALGSTTVSYYDYDYKLNEAKLIEEAVVVPSLSYKIEF